MVYESDVDTVVNDNCYLVKKGVRSAYCDIVGIHILDKNPYDILDKIGDLTKEYGLHYKYRTIDLKDYHKTIEFWIYKYDYLGKIINAIPPKNRTYEQEWMMGKLLGYDDASMDEYLSKF